MKLQIERAVYGGAGEARSPEGKFVRVPFTLPQEIVDAQPSPDEHAEHEMNLMQILQPAPQRVPPQCIHFGACGGCQYQHAAYDAQVAMKVDILRDTMQRAGLHTLPEIALHTKDPWQYRNRIRLRIVTIDGTLRIGYSRRASNQFLPIVMCPIASPILLRAAQAIEQLAAADIAIKTYMEPFTEMELFCTSDSIDEPRLQISFVLAETAQPRKPSATHQTSAAFATFCTRIQSFTPEFAGAGIFLRKGPKTIPTANWGADGLLYYAAGAKYWVGRGAFFQVNRFLIDTMVELVTANRTGALAWDLYAGVGLFSQRLAKSFRQIVAVETAEPASENLQAMLAKIAPQHRSLKSTAVDFLRAAVVQRERPDLIVMDPPRAGLGRDVTALLLRIAPAEMVYVSCDPITLCRDLRAMVDSGYRIESMHMVDMFPQTFHIETVTVLRR